MLIEFIKLPAFNWNQFCYELLVFYFIITDINLFLESRQFTAFFQGDAAELFFH